MKKNKNEENNNISLDGINKDEKIKGKKVIKKINRGNSFTNQIHFGKSLKSKNNIEEKFENSKTEDKEDKDYKEELYKIKQNNSIDNINQFKNIKSKIINNQKKFIGNNSEDNSIQGQKKHKSLHINHNSIEQKDKKENSPKPKKNILIRNFNNKIELLNQIENIFNDKEEINKKPIENSAKRVVNNNKFIYSKEKNIFYVDQIDDSDKEEKSEKNDKISRVNKNSVHKKYKNIEKKENEKNNNENIKNKNEIQENENISYSDNEDIESDGIETDSNFEEEEEAEEEEELQDKFEIKEEKDKEVYLLELEENGLPNLNNDEILSCNINSLINISVYNGLLISKDIRLITNSENEFPSAFYLDEIIEEINSKSQKLNKASPQKMKKHKYITDENNNVLKLLKKYKIFPCKINTKIYFRVSCKRAGNIYFAFIYKDSQNNKTKITKPFNILVNPLIDLNIKNNIRNNLLEINQIQMQSIIPRNIGYLTQDFEKYYEEASLLEYNFIHFHSFEELSSTKNIFIIKNQNELSKDLFINDAESKNLKVDQEYSILNNSIKRLKNNYHIGSITNIILSQTSSESSWIYENKECTYNLKNTPWLNVSYELDKILMNYSKLFSSKKVQCKSAPYIYNINNIDQIIAEITSNIEQANLHEFFMISEEKYIKKFQLFYINLKKEEFNKNYSTKKNILLNEISKVFIGEREDKINEILTNSNYLINLLSKSCINYGYGRFEVKLCVEFMGILIIESYKEKNNTKKIPSENNFIKEVKNYINILNEGWIKQIKELLKITVNNIKEYLRYKYVQLNNKKKIENLIESYFIVKNENEPSEIYLSNGWIMNSEDSNNPFPNTVQYGSWYHLKRKIIIIKDTIKLNYGTNIENTSVNLLNYMSKYISNLSNIFDGLYIDSITSIPISVLKYLIYVGRKANPSIILICNLGRDCNLNDSNNNIISLLKKKYVEELGINLFVEELIWDNNENEIINSIINNGSSCNSNIYPEIITHFSKNLYSTSFIDENKINFGQFKYLKAKKPFNIIYDLYDSQTYFEKFKKLSINLPILSLIGLLDNSIGSIYGFDQLYHILPNLENDIRKYDIDNKEIKNLIEKINNKKINSEETFEVFFEYHPDENQKQNHINYIYSVDLALNVFDYKPNIKLTKIKKNLYMTKTRLPPEKYYYQFVINNNIWTYDNTQPLEKDENGIIYNVIDLRSQNKIIIPDMKLYRKEINKIRNYFKNKQSEIYIQKNRDMYGIIRIITDSKSLVNNNLDEEKILKCKNKISYLSEENNNDDSDYENDDSINNRLYTSPDIKKGGSTGSKDNFAKSFEQVNNLDDSLLFNVNKNLDNSININLNRKEFCLDSFRNKTQNDLREKNLLEASMEVNLNMSYNNVKNHIINEDINKKDVYDGYAVICFPSFDKKDIAGKGAIIIPGKISELICACYFNREKINLCSNIKDKKIKAARNEIYFTKDLNYLKCISNIKYNQNKTIIEFYNAPSNLGIIVKFLNENKKEINNLDEHLEILFNKGNEFINYFNVLEINKLLFRTEKEERKNTNNKRGTYEMKLNLFNDLNVTKINNKENDKNSNLKFIYAGINELVELIKIIKRTENQNLFYNKNKKLEINEKSKKNNINLFNSFEEKQIKIQSLYKDICNNDNYINYIIDRLSEVKSFKLMYYLIKKLIIPEYKLLPAFIKPLYFEKIIISIYQNVIRVSLGKIPSYILNFGDFAIGLSLSIYEFIKKYLSCSFSNRLIKKYDIKSKQNIFSNMIGLGISSGLPINEKNNIICIRDILISFNSLFIIPKLFYEAKIILKLIGSTMKYGLIPEKIDSSNNYRYYSRDISWFYIKAIKDYIYATLDYNFLKEQIFLLNLPENINISYFRQKVSKNKKIFTVENIIQLIFQYHAQGINFVDKKPEEQPYQKRPRYKKNQNNYDVDAFKINIYLDLETGFIFGGNKLNSGTWMNHIGSSSKAKNLNIPATPRDGADIEIIALLYICLNFVIELNYNNYYSYKNVILKNNEIYTFYQWSLLIKKNFEVKFFVKDINPVLQNKINIYKDYINKPSNQNNNLKNEENEDNKNNNSNNELEEEKDELKLRPNVLLAIFYAPDLFTYENILKVIDNIENYLLRPEIPNKNKHSNVIGMNGVKTLDKTDADYNGKLDFKESNNFKTSCGFNIHNGVEFVWLYGIYLMIKIKYLFNFNYDNNENNSKDSFIPEKTEEMIRYVSKKLIPYIKYMKENRYMGVPEIIDEIGNASSEGNLSDLKSMATFLELVSKLAWVSNKFYNDNDNDFSSKDDDE